jgi:hypothetical protein
VARPVLCRFALFSLLFSLIACEVAAAPTSEQLLPNTTRGYVSISDLDDLIERFNKTQLGQLVSDPIFEPFVEDLERQLKERFNRSEQRLGLRFEDLRGVSSGEVSFAVSQPDDEDQPHALIAIVDATGKEDKAEELLDKIAGRLEARQAKRSIVEMVDVDVVHYVVPDDMDENKSHDLYYRLHEGYIVAADHQQVIKDLLTQFGAEQHENRLADVESFQSAMQRCQQAAGDETPQIHWFVDIIGYVNTMRDARGEQSEGKDFLDLFVKQGFSAVRGAGGWILIRDGDQQFTHYSWIDAPKDEAAIAAQIAAEKKLADEGKPVDERVAAKPDDKYVLAARMFDFPNSTNLVPQVWVPRHTTSYISLNWQIDKAFEYAKTLVNELLNAEPGEDLFEEIISGIAEDPNGPQVDLRNDLVANSRGRVTLLTDAVLPITPTSERWLLAFEISNIEAVENAIRKLMEAEPNKRRHEFEGLVIWEIVNEEEDIGIEVEIGGDPFAEDPFGETFDEPEDETPAQQPLLSKWALTVTPDGHLFAASGVDMITDILSNKNPVGLEKVGDYERVDDALKQLGADLTSLRVFTRLDKSYHVNYELLRQGKSLESKTILGTLLKRFLSPKDGSPREQLIDGSKMPPFLKIAKYLGPAGSFVTTEDNGWFISGCLLTRQHDGDMPLEESEEKPAEEKPAEEKPAEEKPAEEKPAEEKPAEEKPAEEKPAEEKPAEEKPAEEKPAEEKPAEEKPAEEKPAEEKPAEEKPAAQ